MDGWTEKRVRARSDRRPCNSYLRDPKWHLLWWQLIWKREVPTSGKKSWLMTAKAPRCIRISHVLKSIHTTIPGFVIDMDSGQIVRDRFISCNKPSPTLLQQPAQCNPDAYKSTRSRGRPGQATTFSEFYKMHFYSSWGALYLIEMASALFLCGAWAARLGLSFTCSYFFLSGVYISIDLLTCLWCQFASP